MARKDVFKNALESLIKAEHTAPRPAGGKSILQSAALGAVDSSLARGLQLAELDPSQIIDSEFVDRLPYSENDLADLIESIRANGQQIPILVQREEDNRYRIIYGRRRLAAIRVLGQKVRALITRMDDEQRIIAQGVENTVRQELSFIEKALFAHRLREGGIEDATIRQALNIDVDAPKASTISTMKMVVESLGADLITAIGRAPGIGRPRWRSLAELYRDKSETFSDEKLVEILQKPYGGTEDEPSDLRFKAVFAYLTSVQAKAEPKIAVSTSPLPAQIKRGAGKLVLTFTRQENPAFHAWVDAQAETLIRDLHDRWVIEQQKQNNGGT